MKFIPFVASLLLILTAQHTLTAQDAPLPKRNVIKVNPLSLMVLHGNVGYERVINDRMSAQLTAFLGSFRWGGNDSDGNIRYTGVGVTPEFRYYFTHGVRQVPEGFYMAPYLLYRHYALSGKETVNGEVTSVKSKVNVFGGGFALGYQLLLGKADAFSLDFLAGPNYQVANIKAVAEGSGVDEGEINGLLGSGIGVRFAITLGAAF